MKENYDTPPDPPNTSIIDSCCACKYDEGTTLKNPNYTCSQCSGGAYLLQNMSDENSNATDSCKIIQTSGVCKLTKTQQDDDTGKLLYNSCKMCHAPMDAAERARAGAETLGVGLLNVFGVGGQASIGFKAADKAEEKAGGIVDSNTMVSKLQSQLSSLKEAALKSETVASINVSRLEYTAILTLLHNCDSQLKYVEQTIQYEIDELTIVQFAFSMCILSILLYIFKAM
jgi:hypothetical protein